jgi:hypothetical protein
MRLKVLHSAGRLTKSLAGDTTHTMHPCLMLTIASNSTIQLHPNTYSYTMPFNIFKSILAAAILLASSTNAQIGNWDIFYQSLATNFQHTVENEITLNYRIGKDRTFNVALFDKDCVGPITGMTVVPSTTRTPSVSANHDGLAIMLNLDKTAITSSNIWEVNSRLQFCVSVQLLSDGAIIKEE